MKNRNKKYDPLKCQRRIIAQCEDAFGNKIALLAHHAFSWTIYKDVDGRMVITSMPREEARKEYKRLERLFSTT
jgi:hypothetical protein